MYCPNCFDNDYIISKLNNWHCNKCNKSHEPFFGVSFDDYKKNDIFHLTGGNKLERELLNYYIKEHNVILK